MRLEDIDTSNFRYSPKAGEFKKNMDKIPEFRDVKIEKYEASGKYKALTYMTLVWDINSELRHSFPNYLERKYEAGIAAGFKIYKDGCFSKYAEHFMFGKNTSFNRAVVKYLSMMYNREYMNYAVLELRYLLVHQDALKTFNKDTLFYMREIEKDMKKHEEVIFGGDETINMRKLFYARTEQLRLRLTPEDLQEEENGLKDYGRYGKEYEVGDLSYFGDELPKK
jgi:hypothetical protein